MELPQCNELLMSRGTEQDISWRLDTPMSGQHAATGMEWVKLTVTELNHLNYLNHFCLYLTWIR